MSTSSLHPGMRESSAGEARRELAYEILSGGSGLLLALFMFGHTILVASILTGERGFDWMATTLEDLYIAQPTVVVIFVLFLAHAAFASRKIPAKLRERRQMIRLAGQLRKSGRAWPVAGARPPGYRPHLESLLWIWQVRTGMVMLVLGSFHIILIAIDVLTPLFGERVGIEAATTLERERAGLWIVYAVLTLCVAFHTAAGLYRLAIKWGIGSRLTRPVLWRLERVIFWSMLGLGALTLIVMTGLIPPPLAGLVGASP